MRADGAESKDRDEQPEAPPQEVPAPPARGALTLAQRLALPEPRRTAELEAAVQRGEQFYLRTTGRKHIKRRYGQTVNTVGPKPRGFSAAHAIHLLFYHPGEIVEVPEAEVSEAEA